MSFHTRRITLRLITKFKIAMKPMSKLNVRYFPSLIIALILVCVAACVPEGRGFRLPEGSVEAGKVAFVQLSCNDCHSIAGIPLKGNDENLNVNLGGKVTTIKTYGELVTSILNPDHRIARHYRQVRTNEDGTSKMRRYNEFITVQDLVDIVTFLESEYEIEPPPTYY